MRLVTSLRLNSSGLPLIAHKCQSSAIRGPAWDVKCALAAVEERKCFDRSAPKRHDTQGNILVFRVPNDTSVVGKERQPFSVRGRMGKPVIVVIKCDLFLLVAVGMHPP